MLPGEHGLPKQQYWMRWFNNEWHWTWCFWSLVVPSENHLRELESSYIAVPWTFLLQRVWYSSLGLSADCPSQLCWHHHDGSSLWFCHQLFALVGKINEWCVWGSKTVVLFALLVDLCLWVIDYGQSWILLSWKLWVLYGFYLLEEGCFPMFC